jgi:uncharacterized repeat protein (TIGR01451 family)
LARRHGQIGKEKGMSPNHGARSYARIFAVFDGSRRFAITAAFAAALFVGTGGSASAATTITVDCASDPSALGTALASATDGDTLTIQGTCRGTFEIMHSLTLSGSGGATLDGQGAGPVVTVDSGDAVVVTGLAITGGVADNPLTGFQGGGIENLGMLTVRESTISGDTATYGGGISNDYGATLTLDDSTVSGDGFSFDTSAGAGILNRGLATVNNTTISGNGNPMGSIHPGFGGGIQNLGTVTVTNSTISGNTAGFGGGVYNEGTLLTVVNSTVGGNVGINAGGGIINSFSATLSMTINASTISGNTSGLGGGVVNDGVATLENTLVAANGAGGDCFNDNLLTDGGYNIDDDGTCGLSSVNHSLSSTDPLLDPAGLQDNGGPTQTIALEPGSPAIDAIPPGANGCGTTITTDQRGVSRPQGAGCDIGAFEFAPSGADLAITKSGAPNPVVSGERLTYTLVVTNDGPEDATGVTVTDPLPSSVHFNSVASAQGSCIRSTTKPGPKDGTVTCNLGDLANAATTAITIVVTTTTPGRLTDTATVTGNESDPNPLNNSATATTTVIGT